MRWSKGFVYAITWLSYIALFGGR